MHDNRRKKRSTMSFSPQQEPMFGHVSFADFITKTIKKSWSWVAGVFNSPNPLQKLRAIALAAHAGASRAVRLRPGGKVRRSLEAKRDPVYGVYHQRWTLDEPFSGPLRYSFSAVSTQMFCEEILVVRHPFPFAGWQSVLSVGYGFVCWQLVG